MIIKPEVPVVFPQNRQQWREWLQTHHEKHQSVWLVYYKKKSATPTLTWSEAVDEALCFGWIDSQAKPLDEEKYQQFFSRRKPKSGWSKVNKAKVQRLITEDKMMPAGLATIETAKQNGSWTLLDEVEELQLPADLAAALQDQPPAAEFFASLSRTDRRNLLQWLVLARRADTRQRRLAAIAELAARKQKPTQFGGQRRAAN